MMELNAVSYAKMSCIFVTADEAPIIVEASEQGMEMLVLQFQEKSCIGMVGESWSLLLVKRIDANDYRKTTFWTYRT